MVGNKVIMDTTIREVDIKSNSNPRLLAYRHTLTYRSSENLTICIYPGVLSIGGLPEEMDDHEQTVDMENLTQHNDDVRAETEDKPAVKRSKLELSSPDEPLTQQDVVAFQKEALFRSIHQYRVRLEALQAQQSVTKQHCTDMSRKLANLKALIVTLARFLKPLCKTQEEVKVCEQVSQGDEHMIVQSSDGFMRILSCYTGVRPGEQLNANEQITDLTVQLKNAQRSRDELALHCEDLNQQIEKINEYYASVIRNYDREESLTLKRVSGHPGEDGTNSSNENAKSNADPNYSVKSSSESKVSDTEASLVPGSELDERFKREAIKHELELSDLQSQIKTLEVTIAHLNSIKDDNEKELIKLKTALAHSGNTTMANGKTEGNDGNEEILLEKIKHLTQENRKLMEVNDTFLDKFHEFTEDKEIFVNKITKEYQNQLNQLSAQNDTLEKDLVRIRTTRDDLLSKVSILEPEKNKSEIITDLQNILDSLKTQWETIEKSPLETTSDALLKEIRDLELAFKDLSNLTHKKYSDYLNHESIVYKLTVEKTKADQKYFAAMRSKDAILVENKNLTKSLTKTNDLLVQAKESENLLQQKIQNLHKQLSLSQNNEKRLVDANKASNLKLIEINGVLEKMKKRIVDYEAVKVKSAEEQAILQNKIQDHELSEKTFLSRISNLQTKCTKLETRLLGDRDSNQILGGDDVLREELQNFRTLVYCSLCSKNWKDMAIKSCGHVFCENCCQERLAARMRKCPTCNKNFSSNDLLRVHL